VFSSSVHPLRLPETVPIPKTGAANRSILWPNKKAPKGAPPPAPPSGCLLRWWRPAKTAGRIACLRYFNPVGSHPSGRAIAKTPAAHPNNLFPFLTQVGGGAAAHLEVFRPMDWPHRRWHRRARTTSIVKWMAEGHRAAPRRPAFGTRRPSTSSSTSAAARAIRCWCWCTPFERACGPPIAHRLVAAAGPGDCGDQRWRSRLARTPSAGRTQRGLDDICRDGWAWQRANPAGIEVHHPAHHHLVLAGGGPATPWCCARWAMARAKGNSRSGPPATP